MLAAVATACLIWTVIVLLPWRPWSTREQICSTSTFTDPQLSLITIVIPARDEAESIATNLLSAAAQGPVAKIILIDDQSTDGTGEIARTLGLSSLEVIEGLPPSPGWSGKLWALHQGLIRVSTPFTLLLDADIELAPGILHALVRKLDAERLDLVSVMARLKMNTFWEALLIPPFIYFFKLLYPFALANSASRWVAAAAGGCILIRTETLQRIGGVAALRDALIDDCTLARLVKAKGGRTWLGLSHDVSAIRPYGDLATIWNMVARTAFTQLRYSTLLLVACSALMGLMFVVPVVGLLWNTSAIQQLSIATVAMMLITYLPVLTYYRRSFGWLPTLPIAAVLYLAMTWTSALRYWRGERSRWKNRSYERGDQTRPS